MLTGRLHVSSLFDLFNEYVLCTCMHKIAHSKSNLHWVFADIILSVVLATCGIIIAMYANEV